MAKFDHVVSILPSKERYARTAYGAVSLCVTEWNQCSIYRSKHLVMGLPCDHVIDPTAFRPAYPQSRGFESRTKAYSRACVAQLPAGRSLLEIHNRPKMVKYMHAHPDVVMSVVFHNDPLIMAGSRSIQDRHLLLRRCAHLYFNSKYTLSRFQLGMALSDAEIKQLSVLSNGIDTKQLSPMVPMAQRKKQIIFVGPIIENKGAIELVRAAKVVLSKQPEWRLLCIGPTTQEPAYAKAFFRELHLLGDQATHLSFMPHDAILRCFAESSIACLPSVWEEPFGRTILEAMSMGCACISTLRGGIPEILAEAGVLVDVLPDGLVDPLRQLMVDVKLRQHFQDLGVRRAKSHFDLQAWVKRLDGQRAAIEAHMTIA